MYKEQYVYINGKVLIENEKKKELFPHYKGFEEIKKQENLVEKIENSINDYKNSEKKLRKERKKTILKGIGYGLLLFVNGLMIVLTSSNFFICLGVVAFVLMGLEIDDYLDSSKRINGAKNVLVYLEEKLSEERVNLTTLQEKEKVYTEPKQEVYLGNINQDKLDTIDDNCDFYFKYAYNQKKYLLMYQLGLLKEKYGKDFTEDGFEILEKLIAQDEVNQKESYTRNLAIKTIRKFRK